ncbi:unnamed protein product [Sphagnum jensenii]
MACADRTQKPRGAPRLLRLGTWPSPTTSPDPSSRCHVIHATGLMSPAPVSRGTLDELSSEVMMTLRATRRYRGSISLMGGFISKQPL